jgi:hypothetical protein
MAKTLKKPSKLSKGGNKKSTDKTKGKTVTKKPVAVKKQKAATGIITGSIVELIGFADETASEDCTFVTGQRLVVVNINESDSGTERSFDCIAEDDLEEYEKDPALVGGYELLESEVKLAKRVNSKRVPGAKTSKDKENHAVTVVARVGELEKMLKNKNPITVAIDLLDDINKKFFYLGGVLNDIFSKKLFEAEFKGRYAWDDFCEGTFGFKGRKGKYLIDIYVAFAAIPGFDIKLLEPLGWSKAKELSRFVTEGNCMDLIEVAKNSANLKDLQTTLKTEFTEEGNLTPSGREATRNGKVKATTYTFKLFEDQAEGVNLALEEGKRIFMQEDLNQVFESIVMGWLESVNGKPTKAKDDEIVEEEAPVAKKSLKSRIKAA